MWKNIPNYEDLYQISDTTLVKRLVGKNCLKERIIKPHKKKDGYLYIGLQKNGKRKTFPIHRLMLESFIGPCPEGKEGCHNNGNKENNLVYNLRWDTPKENNKDKIKHGTNNVPRGSKHSFAKLNELQVIIIKHLLKEGKLLQREIAEIFGVSKYIICHINNNNTWKHISIN